MPGERRENTAHIVPFWASGIGLPLVFNNDRSLGCVLSTSAKYQGQEHVDATLKVSQRSRRRQTGPKNHLLGCKSVVRRLYEETGCWKGFPEKGHLDWVLKDE